MPQRKAVLTCSRVQHAPLTNSTLRKRVGPEVNTGVHLPNQPSMLLLDLLLPCERYFQSKVFSGFISMLVRNAPFPRGFSEVYQVLNDSIHKEILAGTDIHHPRTFRWDSIFQRDIRRRRSIKFHDDYPDYPDLRDEIHYALREAIRSFSKKRLYPDYSKKTVGRVARENMESWLPMESERLPDLWSTMGLEWIYHKFGIRVDGPTEIRWAWKYNNLNPRVYYARGPDQYYASKYIQELFNHLVDSLPVTNRYERFFATSLRGEPDDRGFIYDYSSFTSMLHEIIRFLESLAEFCRGTTVNVVDTLLGFIDRDLGCILDDYIDACSKFPRFDVTSILELDPGDPLFLLHNSGMLGVPGNISSCTLCHGIHLAMILGSVRKGKCVGDDAIGFGNIDDDQLEYFLQGLGIIAMPKVNIWEDTEETGDNFDYSWHYVKRPIDKIQSRFVISDMIIFPPVAILLRWIDPVHTTIIVKDEYGFRKKTASMLLSFALQFSFIEIEEDEEMIANRFLTLFRIWTQQKDIPWLDRELVIPRSIRSPDVVGDIVEDYWHSVIRVPVFWNGEVLEEPVIDTPFVGRSNRMLKLIKDMGYAHSKLKTRSVIVREDEADVRTWLDGSYKALYDIVVFSDCPKWMLDDYKNSVSDVLSYVDQDDALEEEYDSDIID